jgi:tetratricopeptide (TPR) repeat protein
VRLIARADDELYGLASVSAKLGRIAPLLERLDRARSDPADAESSFAFGLAQMAMLNSLPGEFDAHSRFSETIDAFGQVLAVEPRHWLARYGRARLRALIPSSYGNFTVQISSQLDSAAQDLEELLAYQAELEWQPYFASCYALAAVVGYLSGDSARCAEQLAELLRCPPTPVGLPSLGALLCEPLVTLHATCLEPDRPLLGQLMAALYGNQSAVRQALARQPQPAAPMP